MPRNPRRTAAVALVVLVLVAVVAAVAYLVGRSGRDGVSGVTPTVTAPPTGQTAPPSPAYSPTNDEGSLEPALARGPVRAGYGGASAGPAGLPIGYPHDRDGAVAAATNYLMWMNSIKITDKEEADAMAATAAADRTTRSALVQSFDQLRTGMESLKDDQPEPARGAYAIAGYADDSATIYIWSPEVTTDVNGTVDQLWGIDAIPLKWTDDDWKLDGTLIAETGGTAFDPADPTGNPTASEKHAILSRTPADPGGITDTAEQTWLEYANAPE